MTNNTVLALTAHGYVFSFMALNAFVTGCLWKVWRLPDSPLKSKFPIAKSFKHLLKTDLPFSHSRPDVVGVGSNCFCSVLNRIKHLPRYRQSRVDAA
jgi:hypothetical protein